MIAVPDNSIMPLNSETLSALRVFADLAFSRAAGAPLIPGNRVRLLRNAEENYPAWKEAIEQAKSTIYFESYIIHDDDIGRDFAGLLARVRDGAEIVIESGAAPVAVLRTPAPPRRSIEECIALLPEDSPATIDEDFARDVQEAVAAHREPLNPPAWD